MDEFDIDLTVEDVDFDIEEDEEYIRPELRSSGVCLEDPSSDSGYKSEKSFSTSRQLGDEEAAKEKEGVGNNGTDALEDDLDEDDEYDNLMSQIDERQVINECQGQDIPVSSKNWNQNKTAQSKSGINSPHPNGRHHTEIYKPDSSKLQSTPGLKSVSKIPNKSPLKRDLPEEISAFFSLTGKSNPTESVKRTFPGPAGILPSQHEFRKSKSFKYLSYKNPPPDSGIVAKNVAPQRIRSLVKSTKNVLKREDPERTSSISNAPWRSMIQALDLNLKDEGSVLNAMNIAWVNDNKKSFPTAVKIPFLVLVVKEGIKEVRSASNAKARVAFMDHTGVIHGHVEDIFKVEFGDKLVPGTCLAIRNCKIMLLRRHVVLTPAKQNVLFLTTTEEPSEDPLPSTKKDENEVYVTQRASFVIEKVQQDYMNLLERMAHAQDEADVENNSDECSNRNLYAVLSSNVNSNCNSGKTPRLLNGEFFNSENAQVNFATESSGFDEDDDAEFLEALVAMDLELEDDNSF